VSRGVPLRGWRRIANAIWGPPDDPQIYGSFDVDATNLLAFTRRAARAGHELTPTHLVGCATAHALRAVPALNVRLRGGHAVARDRVDVFFITTVSAGSDLTGVKVEAVDRLSAVEVAARVRDAAERLRAGDDPGFERSKSLSRRLPVPILHVALRAAAYAAGELGWSIPAVGVSAEPFGSAMVSSLGSLGLPVAFVPIAWMYRVPLIVVPGAIVRKPVAVDERVEVRPVLPVSVTLDHRYVDGAQLAGALAAFREYLEDPARFEPPLGAAAPADPAIRENG
jgi:pyruvate dehydrogenase E2 component (dihydrolipoamide acetyltransferase)